MRNVISSLLILGWLAVGPAAVADTVQAVKPANVKLVETARARTLLDIRYDPKYVKLSYPAGDVDPATGVCTDVVIRTFRAALNFDFQKAVHEDMKRNFSSYPKNWGLKRADKNIDHRRVANLEAFLKRKGASVPITKKPEDYRPGDIVTWRLGGRLPHIGIISDKKSDWGTPLVIHNVGGGVVEDDLLFNTDINGHFRFLPKSNILVDKKDANVIPASNIVTR